MPLDIIVVGAGIAGLCAAISLRQAGHTVEVFEKSQFAAQFGAALGLTPNGSRVLSQLGFSFTRARACNLERWDVVDGISLARMSSIDHRNSQERFGMPFMTIGRVDLHEELLRLALHTDETNDIKAVKLNLSSKVVAANAGEGLIELENGEKHRADLIIAADGLHSVLKNAVLGQGAVAPLPTGTSAFRFLIPTKVIEEDPTLAIWLRSKDRSSTILADTKDTVNERHMVWYECQGGEVQNFVGIHPTRSDTDIDGEANPDNEKLSMLEEFAHFHPRVLQLIKLAPNVTRWPLSIHDPLTTWSKGRMVLIGDAAHPMMPFGGQGAMQAIEDGGALGYLLRGINDPSDIPQRLRLFEEVRLKRVSTVQILSKVRVGKEKEVEDELRPYADPPGSDVPGSFAERTTHDFGYDIFASCEAAIA